MNKQFLDHSLTVQFSDGNLINIPNVALHSFQKAFQIKNKDEIYEYDKSRIITIDNLSNDSIHTIFRIDTVLSYINYESGKKILKRLFLTLKFLFRLFLFGFFLLLSKKNQEKFFDKENSDFREKFLFEKMIFLGHILNDISNENLKIKPITFSKEENSFEEKIKFYFYERYNVFKIMNVFYNPKSIFRKRFGIFCSSYFIYDLEEKKLYCFTERDLDEYIYFETGKNITKDSRDFQKNKTPKKFNDYFSYHEIKIE